MDCRDVEELLDAYALGAADPEESHEVEKHVAVCVHCWRELDEAKHAASLLALTVPLASAPATLKQRVVSKAKGSASSGQGGMASRWRWPRIGTFAMGLTAAGIAALAIIALLLLRMSDVQRERDGLSRQVQKASEVMDRDAQVLSLLTAADMKHSVLPPTSPGSPALGVYYWSKEAGKGLLVCRELPDLEEGEVFQAWFKVAGRFVSAGTFEYDKHVEQLFIDLRPIESAPEWMGVTIEPEGGSERPSGEVLIAAALRGQ